MALFNSTTQRHPINIVHKAENEMAIHIPTSLSRKKIDQTKPTINGGRSSGCCHRPGCQNWFTQSRINANALIRLAPVWCVSLLHCGSRLTSAIGSLSAGLLLAHRFGENVFCRCRAEPHLLEICDQAGKAGLVRKALREVRLGLPGNPSSATVTAHLSLQSLLACF